MLYIRLSDLRKTKNKDGALEKNVDYQFLHKRLWLEFFFGQRARDMKFLDVYLQYTI